uniref:Si:ch73-23l24.1 n=1 Tax=Scleropages formosus TaxID=113540 RepID=A0A8C9SHW6_SCLFO
RYGIPVSSDVFVLPFSPNAVAEETAPGDPHTGKEKRSVPNWALTSSDFFGWMEYLRAHAAYDKMEDLARTFWAHFPSASDLGYETSELE